VKAVTIPLEQMSALYQFAQSCHECEAKLTAAQTDRMELAEQMQALEAERNAAVRAVKGGTFRERLRHETKSSIGVTAGAAAGAAICAKSSGPVIAACASIGALVGFVVAHF
jgi:hypothetical protein